MLEIGLFFKFGVITWLTKQITNFVKRYFQGRSEKFYEVPDWSFEVSFPNVILNFKVSDQSFEVRGAPLNRFDCKNPGAHFTLKISDNQRFGIYAAYMLPYQISIHLDQWL